MKPFNPSESTRLINLYKHLMQYQQHHYSVPHQYVGERLELHASDTLISLNFRQRQIASHPRKHYPGTTTEAAHMPQRHQKHQQWTPGRLKNWAKNIGPEVLLWVDQQLYIKAHRLELNGESMRKRNGLLTDGEHLS